MFNKLIDILKKDKKNWNDIQKKFIREDIAAKTVLLKEGDIANRIYFIQKGCLREWFNNDGKDVTFQFFFEGQPVASIDSFLNKKPSLFSIESVEPSEVLSIKREDFERVLNLYPELKNGFHELLFQRFRNYGMLFLSRIKDNPQERYVELLKNHPEIIQRVPQLYIASYLGITPVSLSRIRNRKQRKN